jgi:peptidoglycan hydrolase CwlO-like protein
MLYVIYGREGRRAASSRAERGGGVGQLVRQRWTGAVLVLALAGLLALPALSAHAAPAPTSPAIEAKKVQEAAALADLEAKRVELDAKIAEYMAIGRELERTRTDISELGIQLEAGERQLIQARSALASRAVEIYRVPRMGMVEVFIGTRSLQDLFARARYLAIISDHDARLMRNYRRTQSENLYLQQSLSDREANLANLQDQADEQRKQIEAGVAAQQAKATALGADIARLMAAAVAPPAPVSGPPTGGTPTGKYQPDTVISETNFRAATSMSAADIQAFLETQPGSLKNHSGKDYAGVQKTAAEMIADASVKWGISPKVILATLQKEQSLLTATNPSQTAMDWAMGCGKADTFTTYKYQGFGNQIWFGAYKQKQNADLWKPGASQKIDGSKVYPTNPGTHAQYRYTPHFPGVMSFWMIYWRYFGDPLA